MKNRRLRAALAHLERLQANPRLKSAQREELRKAKRELRKVCESGNLKRTRQRLEIAISLIVAAVCGTLTDDHR